MRPQEALSAARERAVAARARGAYADDLERFRVAPAERPGIEQLLEWAVIEPDIDQLRSTRRLGAPITLAKQTLARALRQYNAQVLAQQSRFNLMLTMHVAQLSDPGDAPRGARRRHSRRGPPPAVIVHQVLSGAGPLRRRDRRGARVPPLLRGLGLGRARCRGVHRPAHGSPRRRAGHAGSRARGSAARALLGLRAQGGPGPPAAQPHPAAQPQRHSGALAVGARAGHRRAVRRGPRAAPRVRARQRRRRRRLRLQCGRAACSGGW